MYNVLLEGEFLDIETASIKNNEKLVIILSFICILNSWYQNCKIRDGIELKVLGVVWWNGYRGREERMGGENQGHKTYWTRCYKKHFKKVN